MDKRLVEAAEQALAYLRQARDTGVTEPGSQAAIITALREALKPYVNLKSA